MILVRGDHKETLWEDGNAFCHILENMYGNIQQSKLRRANFIIIFKNYALIKSNEAPVRNILTRLKEQLIVILRKKYILISSCLNSIILIDFQVGR